MLDILLEDEDFVVINKPAGLLVHPSGIATDRVTCLSLVRAQIGGWVYPIHRLDRGASGVVVFGRSSEAARALCEVFADRRAEKVYLAVVRGWLGEEVDLDYPLDDDEVAGSPRVAARTKFVPVSRAELDRPVGRHATARYSLVVAEPLTGRRHQIRRHLAHLRHPIIGDATHGDGRHNRFFRDEFGSERMLLHAHRLTFAHPRSGRPVMVAAPMPEDLGRIVARLGLEAAIRPI